MPRHHPCLRPFVLSLLCLGLAAPADTQPVQRGGLPPPGRPRRGPRIGDRRRGDHRRRGGRGHRPAGQIRLPPRDVGRTPRRASGGHRCQRTIPARGTAAGPVHGDGIEDRVRTGHVRPAPRPRARYATGDRRGRDPGRDRPRAPPRLRHHRPGRGRGRGAAGGRRRACDAPRVPPGRTSAGGRRRRYE
jgi:hypothetical protein